MFHNLLQFQKGSWGFMIMMNVSKGTVLIYLMVIKKKELADAILVNICFPTLLISLLIFVFVFKFILYLLIKKQTKFEKYTVVDTHNPWPVRFLCETDVPAKIVNSGFVNISKWVNKFLEYYLKRWLFREYGTICHLKKHQKYPLRSSILVKLQGATL